MSSISPLHRRRGFQVSPARSEIAAKKQINLGEFLASVMHFMMADDVTVGYPSFPGTLTKVAGGADPTSRFTVYSMHRSLVSLPCLARIACGIKGADFDIFCSVAGEFCVASKLEVTEVATTEIATTFKIWQTGNSYLRK